ncbi:DUF1127 domain-containing protein [Roseomonas eburnea]|uniref:DUF1127 domain-containing protein n=1 Tax=Neoroseomonas eburnea TaxID=1346889 RepID=A0A9X9XJI3_9PROT|nr:DUF1127 domain-containing protein [Neoroseomonas eburnea]MBR0683869.1 DUF1127 domain-containing protein [Neoroseomonas eburnea]
MSNEFLQIGLIHHTPHHHHPRHGQDVAPRRAELLSGASRLRARILRSSMCRAVGRLTRLMHLWRRRLAESNKLREMSDRELRDMNVNRYDVAHAVRRPFWRS